MARSSKEVACNEGFTESGSDMLPQGCHGGIACTLSAVASHFLCDLLVWKRPVQRFCRDSGDLGDARRRASPLRARHVPKTESNPDAGECPDHPDGGGSRAGLGRARRARYGLRQVLARVAGGRPPHLLLGCPREAPAAEKISGMAPGTPEQLQQTSRVKTLAIIELLGFFVIFLLMRLMRFS